MAQVVAIIPARSGSKGVPEKNIRPLAGRPLIAYSIKAAQLTDNIDRVVVSTDSEHYADIAREYGAEVPFLRPAEISGDMNTDYEFIKHTLDWFNANEGRQPKYIVHLRPTTPLRDPGHIKSAIEMMYMDNRATALRSVHQMSESAYKTMEIENGFLKCVGSGSFDLDVANNPRQQFGKTYQPDGYVDVIVSSFVMANHKIHGDRALAYVCDDAFEIDTADDFDYIEYRVASNPFLVRRLFG